MSGRATAGLLPPGPRACVLRHSMMPDCSGAGPDMLLGHMPSSPWGFESLCVPNWDLGTCLMSPVLYGTCLKNSWKCVQLVVFFPSYKSSTNGKGGLRHKNSRNFRETSSRCCLAFLTEAPGVCNMSPGCQTAHVKPQGPQPN